MLHRKMADFRHFSEVFGQVAHDGAQRAKRPICCVEQGEAVEGL
ncbi:hypothetical protein ACT6QH_06265 [Xanthobacter sp. TB0139]